MTPSDLVEVRIVGFPLDVWARAAEHFAGLQREFALLTMPGGHGPEVPQRLLDLVASLTDRFATLTADNNDLRDAAAARGDDAVPELVYQVPAAVAEASLELARMLDEADAFCLEGDVLLTLATPPEAVAFRRWFLGEFVAQVNGMAPLPWPDADQAALVADRRLRGETDTA